MQQGVRTKVIWVFLRYSKSMTRRIVAADIISYLESCVQYLNFNGWIETILVLVS